MFWIACREIISTFGILRKILSGPKIQNKTTLGINDVAQSVKDTYAFYFKSRLVAPRPRIQFSCSSSFSYPRMEAEISLTTLLFHKSINKKWRRQQGEEIIHAEVSVNQITSQTSMPLDLPNCKAK